MQTLISFFVIFFSIFLTLKAQSSKGNQITFHIAGGVSVLEKNDEKISDLSPIPVWSTGIQINPMYGKRFSLLFDFNYSKNGGVDLREEKLNLQFLNLIVLAGLRFEDFKLELFIGNYYSRPVGQTENYMISNSDIGVSFRIQKELSKKILIFFKSNYAFKEREYRLNRAHFVFGRNISLEMGIGRFFVPNSG